MTEKVIDFVIEYIETHLFDPDRFWPDYIFEYRSDQRWAANEILERLYSFPNEPPDLVIERFLYEMSIASGIAENARNQKRFDIAREVAEDILCSIV